MKFIVWLVKGVLALIGVLIVVMLFYGFLGGRDVKKIHTFCDQLQPGLDIRQIATLAREHDVGFSWLKDPSSVDRGELGKWLESDNSVWGFTVGSAYTMGERGCMVLHDGKVVLPTDHVFRPPARSAC